MNLDEVIHENNFRLAELSKTGEDTYRINFFGDDGEAFADIRISGDVKPDIAEVAQQVRDRYKCDVAVMTGPRLNFQYGDRPYRKRVEARKSYTVRNIAELPPEEAIRQVVGFYDAAFEMERLASADVSVRDTDPTKLDAAVALAVLAATHCQRHYLPSRPGYYKKLRDHLVAQRSEAEADNLLKGLE